MRKLLLLLNLRHERELDPLTELLLDEIAFARAHPDATVRVAVRDAAARAIAELPFAPFDAALELGVPQGSGDEELLARATALGPVLEPHIDASSSAVVLGDETEVVPGEGQFHLFDGMRRREGFTLQQFRDYLLAVHSQYGVDPVEHPGYRQLHADPEATAAAGRAAGVSIVDVDGVSQLLLRDAGALSRLDPQLGLGAVADSANFAEDGKDVGMITRVLAVAGPVAPQPAAAPRLLPSPAFHRYEGSRR
jgi:hypothetical protein